MKKYDYKNEETFLDMGSEDHLPSGKSSESWLFILIKYKDKHSVQQPTTNSPIII